MLHLKTNSLHRCSIEKKLVNALNFASKIDVPEVHEIKYKKLFFLNYNTRK